MSRNTYLTSTTNTVRHRLGHRRSAQEAFGDFDTTYDNRSQRRSAEPGEDDDLAIASVRHGLGYRGEPEDLSTHSTPRYSHRDLHTSPFQDEEVSETAMEVADGAIDERQHLLEGAEVDASLTAIEDLEDEYDEYNETSYNHWHDLVDIESLPDTADAPATPIVTVDPFLDAQTLLTKAEMEELDKCPICYVPYLQHDIDADDAPDQTVLRLPCSVEPCRPHAFHRACISTWLAEHGDCPDCRPAFSELGKQGERREVDAFEEVIAALEGLRAERIRLRGGERRVELYPRYSDIFAYVD